MLHFIQQALFADKGNDFFHAFALPEIGKHKRPIAALFFGISGHDLQIGTDMRCQVSLIDDQQI
jgi:hypothetical protein